MMHDDNIDYYGQDIGNDLSDRDDYYLEESNEDCHLSVEDKFDIDMQKADDANDREWLEERFNQ